MTDLERLLTEALRESGENYEPSDQAEARRRFLERARRRRWYGFAQVAAVAGLGIAAFLFFTYGSGPEEKVTPKPELVAGAPEIVARIEVGGDPISVDAATGSQVWVSGDDRVVAIDPEKNRTGRLIIDLPADEIAVADDLVWIAQDGSNGAISYVDAETGEVSGSTEVSLQEGVEARWDIATDGETLWAVDGGSGDINAFDEVKNTYEVRPDQVFSDVAYGDGHLWLLNERDGRVTRFESVVTRVDKGEEELSYDVPQGENSDLGVGVGYVWVSPGDGTLVRIVPATGDQESLPLGDSYMDLSVDEKSVWALVTVDDEHKKLFEINPGTMEVIGEPLEIEGDANDVVATAGSVWVADGRGEVLRIEPSRDADDPPPPAEDDDQSNVEPSPGAPDDQIVFVYSANGDLFGENQDGSIFQLTDTPEIEQHPSFAPDGNSIVFEREHADEGPDGGTDDPDVVQLHLGTGEEEVIGSGSWPALAPDGRLASVASNTEVNDQSADSIDLSGLAGDVESIESHIVGTPELPNISHLSWSPDGGRLVWQAAGEGTVVKEADVDGTSLHSERTLVPTEDVGGFNESSDFADGSNLVSPQASSDGVLVLRLCCRETDGDPYEDMHVGRVRQDIEGVSYEDLGSVLGAGIAPDLDTEFVPAGNLALDADADGHQWRTGSDPSWFLFDPRSLWLVLDNNTSQHVSGDGSPAPAPGHETETDFRGLAVNPSLLD